MPSPAAVGRIKTHDIDEYQLVVPPWDVTLRQMSPGMFHAEVEYLQVNGMLLYREQWSKRVMVNGGTPAGFFSFGGPRSAATRVVWCGTELGPNCMAFGNPSTEVDFVIPEGSHHVVLLVPQDLLARYLDAEGMAAVARLSHWLGRVPGQGENLLRMIDGLVGKYQGQDALLADKRLAQAIERQLLGTIAELIFGPHPGTACLRPRHRHTAMQRAIDYVEDLHAPMSVPDLAQAARVSQRTLEYAFKDALGITPRTYLRWNRLNRVRRELLAAPQQDALVSEAADNWGFSELGRFAVEYKHLFGESPSSTLARDGQRPPKSLAEAVRGP